GVGGGVGGGGGLGSLLLIALLAVGAFALLRAFAARRPAAAAAYPHAGAGGATAARSDATPSTAATIPPAWGAGGAGAAGKRYPAGFDPGPFVAQAREQFRRLQAAYDRGDAALLADVTTPEMLAQLEAELATRGTQAPTDVVTLDAEVLEVEREGAQYVASVRFHGSLREDGAATPQAFEEVWNLVKPVDGSSGWLLAGIQQYA
ncbi:MAG: Tim44 domain-containing protein, partial [Candidatus Levyibacteriota bacterium]